MPTKTASRSDVQERYERALSTFVERARKDPYILAVVLCGSLSHDRVWEKSDIDLFLICKEKIADAATGDEGCKQFSLTEDGINIHATMQPRSTFRKMVEGSAHQNAFIHSLIAKSKLVFTRDPTIEELFNEIQRGIGARDQQVQMLRAASGVIAMLYKAEKWFHVRGDMNYSFIWIMGCVTELAKVEVYAAGQLPGREVVQQALELNPDFFNAVYTDLIAARKTPKTLATALSRIDNYLTRRTRRLFGPILEHLKEVGVPRSATELETHFANAGIGHVVTACEWLADKEVISKVSTPIRLTEKSAVAFEELAFYYDGQG